jgi:hypothetical protein
MTPLAHQVLKQLVLPPKRRSFDDRGLVLPMLQDVHYFDCRAVWQAAHDLQLTVPDEQRQIAAESIGFLPAPKTWIETKTADGGVETGYLLVEKDDHVNVHLVLRESSGVFRSENAQWRGILTGGTGSRTFNPWSAILVGVSDEMRVLGPVHLGLIAGCLALINTPRSVGRKQHDPHAGLRKLLGQKFQGRGGFKLHPWTEILLEIAPEGVTGAGLPRFAADRALHFVRRYMRVRNGRAEIVSSHWRGDVALGIRQSTYRVTPPADGEDLE